MATLLSQTTTGRTLLNLTSFIISNYTTLTTDEKLINLNGISAPVKLSYSDGESQTQALFFEAQGKRSGTVIISWGIGASAENIRLIFRIAENFRNSNVNVLFPLPKVLVYEDVVTHEGIRSYVNAFKFLEKSGLVESQKIGFVGFCAGGSFVLMAAQDREIASRVAFVSSLAPYNNMRDFFVETISETAFEDSKKRAWQPHKDTRKLMLKNLLVRMPNGNDREILSEIFLEARQENPDDLKRLTPQGQYVFEILKNPNFQNVKEKLSGIPGSILKDMDELSPQQIPENQKNHTFIIHDFDDPFTPIEESDRLARKLGPNASFAKTTAFDHTILDKEIAFGKLFEDLSRVLGQYFEIFLKLN